MKRILFSYFWLLLSALFFAYGEYLSKKWADVPSWRMGIAVIGIDAISTALWLPAILNRNHLGIVGLLWLLIGAVATIGISLFLFRETLDWVQWMGIGFAFVALVLLSK